MLDFLSSGPFFSVVSWAITEVSVPGLTAELKEFKQMYNHHGDEDVEYFYHRRSLLCVPSLLISPFL